jgi:acyl carrier protein
MSPANCLAPSRETIEDWLTRWIAKELGMPPGDIEADKSLLNYSLSSVTAMMLVGDLEEWLHLTLPPTLVWDYPSIAAIADYLTEQLGAASAPASNGVAAHGDGLGSIGAGAAPTDALDAMSDQEVTALINRMMAEGHAEV